VRARGESMELCRSFSAAELSPKFLIIHAQAVYKKYWFSFKFALFWRFENILTFVIYETYTKLRLKENF